MSLDEKRKLVEIDKKYTHKSIKNIPSLDIAKFLMAIMVVAIHTEPLIEFSNINNIYIYKLSKIFEATAVPFFSITSAYLLYSKYRKNNNDISVIKEYLIKMTKLYIIWSLIYLPFAIYEYSTGSKSLIANTIIYIRNFITTGQHYYSWPLWYLLSSIYSIFLSYIIIKRKQLKNTTQKLLLIGILFFLLGELVDYLITNISSFQGNSALYHITLIIKYTFVNGKLLKNFIYFPIGMILTNFNIQPKKILLILSVTIFVFFSYYTNFSFLIVIISTLIFLIIINTKLKTRIMYKYLRRSSIIIYFTHMIFFFIWSMIVGTENCCGIAGFIFTILGSITLSIIICNIDCNSKNRLLHLLNL